MTQCAETCIAVHCYEGDAELVKRAMPIHKAHGCDIVCLSPTDSPVNIPIAQCQFAGNKAYIGEQSWIRQREQLKILMTYPHDFFLLNDADSFCVSARIPDRLYVESEDTLWSNEVVEPRPHASPYPKIAAQPPYFLTRRSLQRIIDAYSKVPLHPITPYIDFAMIAWACEAGLKHRSFEELETPSSYVFRPSTNDPEDAAWQCLDYRIRYRGVCMCHPIKTQQQLDLCVNAGKFYERQ